MQIAGNIIISIGILFMICGVIGLFKYNSFSVRILVCSEIDTAGAITVIAGIVVKHGLNFFSLTLLLLMTMMLILNPLITHMIARSAHLSSESSNHDNEDDI